ncbi:nitrite reductase [Sesbania bispinosa]|nr:nitrite reductase [Sesbania bispinosa]
MAAIMASPAHTSLQVNHTTHLTGSSRGKPVIASPDHRCPVDTARRCLKPPRTAVQSFPVRRLGDFVSSLFG